MSVLGQQVPPHEPLHRSMSVTTRITLLCVGVALVAAVLASAATARALVAAERASAPVTLRQAVQDLRTGNEKLARAAQTVESRPIVVQSLLLSMGVGVAVGAAAGGSLARVLTRPLRRTTETARAMGAGRRDLRVPIEGPPEIADVAVSLNELADALQHSEDRQRRFLLSVSHELRTPLTAVRGFAESIADGVVTGDDAGQAGRVILAESQRLEGLVRDLLDLARLGADDFRLDLDVVDLDTLLGHAETVWRTRAAERGVELRVERPGQAIVLRTDPARLRQVIDGLAENALRLTPRGAPVVLSLRAPTFADLAGTRAVIQVRDGGPGLAVDDYAVAFEPGVLGERYRDDRPGGVGIGLSLVHGLVQRLGGAITAGPAPEGGAAFTVFLADAP
ncbi:alkaline phosphatase synthesis sensor protein PhoR [mine drainage metagenome]|uniref:Signal transduction histidine-protein kinase/phosphatase MprB n=1 Tax=mine drainage metagenome TaxID=410659 RepID=A0A1J5RC94_9ZZZZ